MVLVPTGPVCRHPGLLLPKDREHLLDLLVVDDLPQTDLVGVVGGDHERQVSVGEAEHQVLTVLAEDVLLLALFDHGRAVVGVNDLVTDVE